MTSVGTTDHSHACSLTHAPVDSWRPAGGRAGPAAWEAEDLAGEGGSWAEAGQSVGKAESGWKQRQRGVLHPERSRKAGSTVGGERDGSGAPVVLRRLARGSRAVSLP